MLKREKLIERARRLYAMSQDTSSPEEAAIAARRVRSLLDNEGITLEDLEQAGPDQFGTADGNSYKAVPAWYSTLALGVGKYMDCITRIELKNGRKVIRFKGLETDSAVSVLTMEYLISAMERGLKRYKKDSSSIMGRSSFNAFRRGFSLGMQAKLFALTKERREQPAIVGCKSLVVVKKQLVEQRFGSQRTSSSSYRDNSNGAFSSGEVCAARTSLNKQVRGGASQPRWQ